SRALKNKILTYPSAAPQYFRLGRFLRNYPYQGRIEVHRGWDRLDYLHARQIASLPNVRMTLHETHRHDLAGVLKRRGFLYRLILETLDIGEHQAPIAQLTERRRYARIRSRVRALVATATRRSGRLCIVRQRAAVRAQVHEGRVMEEVGHAARVDTGVALDLPREVALVIAGSHEQAPVWIEQVPRLAGERRDLGIQRE